MWLDHVIDASTLWNLVGDGDISDPYVQDYLMQVIYDTPDTYLRDELVYEFAVMLGADPRIPNRYSKPDSFSCPWIPVKDGDPRARELYERHYSARKAMARRKKRKTKLFVGPGEKLVLLTRICDALFIWRREVHRMDGQYGVNCAVFRNEGRTLSSELILWAEVMAQLHWPRETRAFTYVDPAAVTSRNPGYCFIKAGWHKSGKSKKGLWAYDKSFTPATILFETAY